MFRFAMQKSVRSAFATQPVSTVTAAVLGLELGLLILVGLDLGLISLGCGPPT